MPKQKRGMIMRRAQSGFTLIELIAVLVILGIIASVAVPKFINLTDEAQQVATNAVAKTIESASSMNHAVDIAVEAGISSDAIIAIDNCNDAASLLADGLPANYTVNTATIADHAVAQCTVTRGTTSETATYRMIGVQ